MLLWACLPCAAADRPNVLLICVDDLKPALGCYGDALAKTPHIDRLAGRSLRFDRAYCNQAVCAPSRNALLTSLRPQTLGIYDLATNVRQARPDVTTFPQHFKAHGYRAEGIGKIFHAGHGNHDDEASWSVPHSRARGSVYALEKNRAADGGAARAGNRDPAGAPQAAYEMADVPDDVYADGAIAAAAIERIASLARQPDTPFFLAVGFIKPHLPFCAPRKYWDLHDRAAFPLPARSSPPDGAPSCGPTTWGELRKYRHIPERGPLDADTARALIHGYYAATSYMDAQLGRVLDALEQNGLAGNTIVVLWGDHGWHLGDHGMWCKHSNYEQAARIPVLVHAPGSVQGRASGAFLEAVDLFPTVAELAGLPVPPDLDGTSHAGVVRGEAAGPRDHVIHVYPRGEGLLGRAIRTDRYRMVEWKKIGADAATAVYELYDYRVDPLETRNLAAERPDVMARLQAVLARHPEARPQIGPPRADERARSAEPADRS